MSMFKDDTAMNRLAGKVVLVTGGTSGIGVDIARRLVEEGAIVGVAGRNEARGNAVAAEFGDRACFIALDVSDEESWRVAVETMLNKFDHLDVFVNNAGVMSPGDAEATTLEQLRDTLMTNTGGVFLGCRAAIGAMKCQDKPGSIVNVLSTTAVKTSAWTLAYGASKAAALSINKSVALYCAAQGYPIRCNAVLPGVVMTPMVEALLSAAPDREAALADLTALHPIGRLLQGVEVANAVVYLASEESSGVTGTEFAVDGGCLAC